MLFKNIVRNFSNNVHDDTIYCKLIDDYMDSLECKGIDCNGHKEAKKIAIFFVAESAKKREIEKINEEFWMSVCHDIKNPMISIDFALREAGKAADKEILKDIYSLNRANLEFIRAILENYRFEEGFFEKKREKINLKDFLRELVKDYKYILKERRLKIDLRKLEKDLVLDFCPISISRVFSNLIANAVKFAHKGSKIIIENETLENDVDWVFISVKNYGEKIKNLEGIFEKFISHTGSSGLGLHICKKIVKEAGGEIWAENFDGGVKFCLLLKA